jgi:hypothetical protein
VILLRKLRHRGRAVIAYKPLLDDAIDSASTSPTPA